MNKLIEKLQGFVKTFKETWNNYDSHEEENNLPIKRPDYALERVHNPENPTINIYPDERGSMAILIGKTRGALEFTGMAPKAAGLIAETWENSKDIVQVLDEITSIVNVKYTDPVHIYSYHTDY